MYEKITVHQYSTSNWLQTALRIIFKNSTTERPQPADDIMDLLDLCMPNVDVLSVQRQKLQKSCTVQLWALLFLLL